MPQNPFYQLQSKIFYPAWIMLGYYRAGETDV